MVEAHILSFIKEQTSTTIFGLPKSKFLAGFYGGRVPKFKHIKFFLEFGEEESIKQGFDTGAIVDVLSALCTAAKLYSEVICPLVHKR